MEASTSVLPNHTHSLCGFAVCTTRIDQQKAENVRQRHRLWRVKRKIGEKGAMRTGWISTLSRPAILYGALLLSTGCLEKVRQWCSRGIQILNVPQRVRRQFSLASALPDGLFEHPDALLTSTPIWTVPPAYGVETEFFRSLLDP